MESAAFDSNRYARRLVEAGVSPENANLQAEAIGEVMQAVLDLGRKLDAHIADTRQNFTELRALISKNDSEVRALIDKNTSELRTLISKNDSEVRALIDKNTSELRAPIDKNDAELRALISVNDAQLRALIAQTDSSLRLAIAQSEKRLMRWILLVGAAIGVWQGLLALGPRLLS